MFQRAKIWGENNYPLCPYHNATVCYHNMCTFQSMRPPMMNGLKTVTKQRTDEGSKLLILAMLPVPKNADNRKNICRLDVQQNTPRPVLGKLRQKMN